MGRVAFLFPGQGAQFVGMGRDLIEHDAGTGRFLTQAEGRLELPLRRLLLDGPPEELQATENTQPAIVFHSLALLRLLQEGGAAPAAVAGHSLGEFAGLVAADGLDPLDALGAVQARGRAMGAASAGGGAGMVAVLGLDDEVVERICGAVPGVNPANYNAPGQVVISGTAAALQDAGERLKAAGARRLVPLAVSAAFHSPLMADAARAFGQAWEKIPLRRLRRPQVFNADAQVHEDPGEVRPLMVGQLTGPVRWTQSVRRLRDLGIDTYVEIGPKRTLSALVKKILPEAVVHNVEDLASVAAYLRTAHG